MSAFPVPKIRFVFLAGTLTLTKVLFVVNNKMTKDGPQQMYFTPDWALFRRAKLKIEFDNNQQQSKYLELFKISPPEGPPGYEYY